MNAMNAKKNIHDYTYVMLAKMALAYFKLDIMETKAVSHQFYAYYIAERGEITSIQRFHMADFCNKSVRFKFSNRQLLHKVPQHSLN